MEVQFGPNSVDEPNLLYKLQRKIKVFNTQDTLPNRGYNLIASSSKYGLVFVASPDGSLSVYHLKELVNKESEPQHLSIKLQKKPTHIAVSCDQELLAVTGGQLLCVYKITDFQNQNVSPAVSLRCETSPSTFVSAMQWNPCIPDSIAIVFYDGTLLACQVSSSQMKKVQSKGRCLCWSPKGKQFVTGNSDGTLTQYKPELTPAKAIPAPKLFDGAPVEALAVYWISTFQFAVVYKNATDNSRPAVTIINTPKAGQPSCLNYEDICYSMGGNRPWYYYLHGLAPWNLILSSSSNSMEIATLASADGASWLQWCQTDEARPELPLTDKKQENYPVGICIDTAAIHQLPWGENELLPFMPLLLVVSQTGLLTMFNVINLNKQAAQVCTPPQQLALPAGALTTAVPGEMPVATQPVVIPQPVATPHPVAQQPVAPKPQPPPSQPQPQPVQTPSAVPQFGSSIASSAAPTFGGFLQQQTAQRLGDFPQMPEQKQPVQVKPTPTVQQAASVQKVPTQAPPPTTQSQEAHAAAKAEQERIKAAKALQEMKSMLLKEVNEFQMELYKFMVKSRDTHVKLQKDIENINFDFSLQSLNAEQLKKECSLDDIRGAIIQLKLDLVRACAVVAEARTHAEAKELHQWTQADPLTTKRVASVKKLAYYVQNQVDQAYKALDYKWNKVAYRESMMQKPGQFMTRPILDDVYQPLVKQQEILCRQEAVLRTLKNTLKEVDSEPMFKSTSLLRSTPFRNKDPLSKLTKNILNMSIEPQTKPREPTLSAQKLDALRDMLSNHKTIKIKPVNLELRAQLAAMRLSRQNNAIEKAAEVKVEESKEHHDVMTRDLLESQRQSSLQAERPQIQPFGSNNQRISCPPDLVKVEPKKEIVSPAPFNIPSFTPVVNAKPGLMNVARTLFADEPKAEPVISVEQPKPVATAQKFAPQMPKPSFTNPPALAPADNTRSVLKDLLQKKQANAAANDANAKSDANTFMGQKICSPAAFSFNAPNVELKTESPTFSTAKPPSRVLDTKNIFSNFQPQPFIAETKPKSSETGEPETPTANKTIELKKEEKPITNLFGSKPLVTSLNKDTTALKQQEAPKVESKVPIKVALKVDGKTKENVPEKLETPVQESQKIAPDKKDSETKPLGTSSFNFSSSILSQTSANVAPANEPPKPAEVKADAPKKEEKENPPLPSLENSGASSLFAAANASSNASKPQSIFGTLSPTATESATPSSPQPIITPSTTAEDTKENTAVVTPPASSASSIFSTAVASQASKTTQAGSIFSTSTASVFSSTGSLFGTSTTTTTSSVFGSTTPSVFSSEAKPSVFSTSTPATAFGATSTTQSVFASTPSVFAQATSAQSVFASSTSGSIFGTATSQTSGTTTTTTSIFGTATTQSSVFGSPKTTAASVFGAAATTQPSVFSGTSATSPASVFGAATTTQSSVFGTVTTTSQPSVFGSAATTTQASLFGTSTTAQSVFGTATSTTQASVFGAANQSVFGATPSTQASAFGSPSTQASVFGSTTPSTQASVFGSPTATTQSVFGSTPATTTQGSLFGSSESNLFAAASISTTSAPAQNTGSIFGGSPTGSVFGGGSTNVFGGKATFSQSNPTAAAIFGGGASFGQKQPQANNFWSGGANNTATTGFGSGFGQQAQATQASSIFGSGGGSFSTPSPTGSAFGSPQAAPAFGAADNKPSVFGSPQQQAASAFGGSPVFGSKPVFGQSPGFGSSPTGGGFGSFGGFNKSPSSGFGAPAAFGGGATFGGAPTFGSTSPGKVFGGSPTGGFGSPTQSNATFESLATQNTLTFGNLAQQSAQQQQAAPSFNTSPAFTGWRG